MNKLSTLFFILIFFSCTKVEDIIIRDNTLPPDHTIENITIETYINKLYISTIGREPTQMEFSTDFEFLRNTNLSQESREIIVDGILNKSEYPVKLFSLESANILNGVDTSMIAERIDIYESLLNTTSGPDSIFIVTELQRMLLFQQSILQFNLGQIKIKELYISMVKNNFFDEINMGTENFVVAMFQHFLLRYPSSSELEAAKDMVDNNNAVVFFESGMGKDDFIDIFFASEEYYAGQVHILFNRYLFRDPTSSESVDFTLQYISSDDYKQLQKSILTSNEFIGL